MQIELLSKKHTKGSDKQTEGVETFFGKYEVKMRRPINFSVITSVPQLGGIYNCRCTSNYSFLLQMLTTFDSRYFLSNIINILIQISKM